MSEDPPTLENGAAMSEDSELGILAARFVLGELEPRERAEAERLLDADPAFRARVDELSPIAATLAELPLEAWPASARNAPPPKAGDQRATREPSPRRPRARLRARFALAGVGVALTMAGVLTGYLLGGGPRDRTRTFEQVASVELRPVEPRVTPTQGTVAMSSDGRMTMAVHHLKPSGRGRYYELWLIDDPRNPVPIASFRVGPTGDARLAVRPPVDPSRYRLLDVSLQRAGAGAAHSGDSVLQGRVPG